MGFTGAPSTFGETTNHPEITAFLHVRSLHGGVDERAVQTRRHAGDELPLGDLILQLGICLRRRQVRLLQELLVGVLIELPGDGIEELGNGAQLVHHELVAWPHALAAHHVGEGFAERQLIEHPPVQPLGDGVLHGDLLLVLLFDLGLEKGEAVLELV